MKNFYGRIMMYLDILILLIGVDQIVQVQVVMDCVKDQFVCIMFEVGDYYVVGLWMWLNVVIIFLQGVWLCFVIIYDVYVYIEVLVEVEQLNCVMIVVNDVINILILGFGLIWCNGFIIFSCGDDEVMGICIFYELCLCVMVLDGCYNVILMDLRVEDLFMWILYFVNCCDMYLLYLMILNDL